MASTPNISWTNPDPYAGQYADIIATVRAKPDATLYPADLTWFDKAKGAYQMAIQARHVLYWVNKAPSYVNGQQTDPSDTDSNLSLSTIQAQNPSLGTANTLQKITTVTKYAGLGVGVGLSLGHAGISALAAGTAIGGALSVASIALFGAGLAVMPILMITAHHAAAVAAEHKNNANAVDYANSYLNAIQPVMAQGQCTTAEFETFAAALMRDFASLNQGSYKKGNAAWSLRNQLACVLETYRRINRQLQGIAQGIASQAPAQPPTPSPATPSVGAVAPPAQPPVPSAGAGVVQATITGGIPTGLLVAGGIVIVGGALLAE